MTILRRDLHHARAASPRNGAPQPGGYAYRGSGTDTLTPDLTDAEARQALGDLVAILAGLLGGDPAPWPPQPPRVIPPRPWTEDLDELIAVLAEALDGEELEAAT